jgi:NAD(P)-dependent dehydrogenase (short-subunit alcohol dehydrogenase family)
MEDVRYNFLVDQMEAIDSDSATKRLRAPPNTILEVNVIGVIYGVKLAIHHMKKTGGGWIPIIGSAASYYPVPYQSIYSASKHAVLGLMRTVSKRADIEGAGVSVGLVCPWPTLTPLTSIIRERSRCARYILLRLRFSETTLVRRLQPFLSGWGKPIAETRDLEPLSRICVQFPTTKTIILASIFCGSTTIRLNF